MVHKPLLLQRFTVPHHSCMCPYRYVARLHHEIGVEQWNIAPRFPSVSYMPAHPIKSPHAALTVYAAWMFEKHIVRALLEHLGRGTNQCLGQE
jgi:hypothetical protein